ncbi:MAG: type VI secretion system baseplate subunit TssK, partial [Curvibacter sp.]|nr:type VI secretion system baseplate subunit TssK [Curvibacter sp.]
MAWQHKVVWSEGMFLRPQHFQQQERYLDFLVQARSEPAQPFFWGFSELRLDTRLLALGQLGLVSASGVLPDGTPFSIPQQDEAPPALMLGTEASRDVTVCLALPLARRSSVQLSHDPEDRAMTRYLAQVGEVPDVNEAGAPAAELQTAATRLRLRPQADTVEGWVSLPVAQVLERKADGTLRLDEGFIAPVLNNGPASSLLGFCQDLQGLLRQRGAALEERLTQPGRGGVAEVGDFLLLQFVNRWLPAVTHWGQVQRIHPERLFEAMLQMAGELATFTRESRRPEPMPDYDHDDLRRCFVPLMLALRAGLSSVLEQNAMQIELQERLYGVRVALIPSTELLDSCDFVLAVHAQAPAEFLRSHFPGQAKLGPVEKIRDLVNLHLPGVALRSLPVAPREIPYHAGYTYFEVDTGHELWRQLHNSGG